MTAGTVTALTGAVVSNNSYMFLTIVFSLMLAATYLIMVLLISWGVRALEAKMKKSER